jgi:hypothetical protein
MATAADVERWIVERLPDSNIALRLPPGSIGLDVDVWKGPEERRAWEELEDRFGPLPLAPRCTSRDDGVSGIRLFRVPADYMAVSCMDERSLGISATAGEVIQHHHRYVVAQPSTHPDTGQQYQWKGLANGQALRVENLPELPESWLDGLRARSGRVPIGGRSVPAGWTNPDIPGLLREGIPAGQNQHEVLRDVCWSLARQGVGEAEAWRTWSDIVDRTPLTRPCEPWTADHFRRHWKGALQKIEERRGAEDGDEEILLPPVPVYPSGEVCGPLGEFVRTSGFPHPLAGGAGLAVMAALAGSTDLVMPDGGIERPNLWIPLIAPPDGGKSQVFEKQAVRELRRLEAQAAEQYAPALAAWQARPAGERPSMPPADPSLIVDNSTFEEVACQLHRGTGIVLILPDELRSWLASFTRYKSSSDDADWLKRWTGVPLLYSRRGGSKDVTAGLRFTVQRAVVVVTGGIPDELAAQLGNSATGLRHRFLPHYSAIQSPGYATWTGAAQAAWAGFVRSRYAVKDQRRDYQMAEGAKALWHEAQATWKQRMRSGEKTPGIGKADIHAARVALVIADSMNARPGQAGFITSEAMDSAIAIVNYSLQVGQEFPAGEILALSRRDEVLAPAVEVLRRHLERMPGQSASRREIQHAHIAGVRSTKDVNVLLSAYEDQFPGCVRTENPPSGSGGKPRIMVHAPARHAPQPRVCSANSGVASGNTAIGERVGGEEIEITPAGQSGAEIEGARDGATLPLATPLMATPSMATPLCAESNQGTEIAPAFAHSSQADEDGAPCNPKVPLAAQADPGMTVVIRLSKGAREEPLRRLLQMLETRPGRNTVVLSAPGIAPVVITTGKALTPADRPEVALLMEDSAAEVYMTPIASL